MTARLRRIRIEQPEKTRRPSGQEAIVWKLFAEAWANVRGVNGREFTTSGSDTSAGTASFRINYREGITAQMRVVHRGTVYEILAVLPDMARRRHVDLACQTGVRQGGGR